MKQAKIMLASISILTILAGALAFKANKIFSGSYCIVTTLMGPCPQRCTGQLLNSKFSHPGGPQPVTYCYTTKTIGDICTQKICPVSTSFITE